MNLAKAIYYNSIAPENISQLVLNIVKGFEDTKIRNLNYFDLFIIIPFYSYRPAQQQFERIVFNQVNSFQREIERNPDIFSNFSFQYRKKINHIKLSILYSFEKDLILMGDDMKIQVKKKIKKE